MKTKKQLPSLTYWNYRVFRHETTWEDEKNKKHTAVSYGLHETYYDELGQPNGWTKDPLIVADSIKELLHILDMMKKDIKRFPEVLDYENKKED